MNSTKRMSPRCPASKEITSQDHVMYGTTSNTVRFRDPQGCSIQTSCYSTNKPHNTEGLLKPLPKTPDVPFEGVSARHPKPGILTSQALAPPEQQLLQCLQWLDHPFLLPRNVLVRLGTDAFWMSAQDANMLERMEMLTETISLRQKDEIWMRLEGLLMPQHRYPLKQVLRHGVAIVVKRPECVENGRVGGSALFRSDDTTTHRIDYDEWMRSLFPAPLRVRKRGRVAFEEEQSRDKDVQVAERADKTSTDIRQKCIRPDRLLPNSIEYNQPSSIAGAKACSSERCMPETKADSRVVNSLDHSD